AGLVIQEMLLRHRARTVFVVCPASLQEKWRVEMLEKFGLEFKIVNTEYVKELRRARGIHANPWTSFPADRIDRLDQVRGAAPAPSRHPSRSCQLSEKIRHACRRRGTQCRPHGLGA